MLPVFGLVGKAVSSLPWKSKWFWGALIAGALVFVGWKTYTYVQHERQARIVAELALVGEKQLNDSTTARLTSRELAIDSLRGVVTAAHALNGRLVAALAITVPKRDTIIVNREIPTTADSGKRTATFNDSTFAGRITGTVTAPVYPAPLQIEYKVERHAFTPSVGFVQVGDTVVATVVWQDEKFSIQAPYWNPVKPRADLLGAFIEGDLGVMGPQTPTLRGGLFLQPLRGLKIEGMVQQVVGDSASIRVGVRKDFRIF